MELFEEINRQGTTILMVTHSEKIVNDMNKRVIELDRGMLIRDEKKGGYTLEDQATVLLFEKRHQVYDT